ncbi:hypothetical protein FF38_06553 [Lucilia cuprina]|uniref:BPTI/Kunitz inhibitor domain-containing protein n=1 Tax=Lucilia cuprina TaxID=7375 RepID=A0A0L0C597_LUCCU|nr:kunitz-type serine protease inhibitor homolog dendrotoxin I-like [Lucilia cuprina]KAI8121625.1 Kunitz-type U19-barytoxin-Tl1a [Lucilia cuprina]KNC27412.1 hypothetical protein FF38_06553 [Lucilia cuprina]
MNFLHILSLLLVAFVASASAQLCPGSPLAPACAGSRNDGRGGRGCVSRRMWYWDGRSRQCREMRYMGCGGNSNRWCSWAACQRRCRRR